MRRGCNGGKEMVRIGHETWMEALLVGDAIQLCAWMCITVMTVAVRHEQAVCHESGLCQVAGSMLCCTNNR